MEEVLVNTIEQFKAWILTDLLSPDTAIQWACILVGVVLVFILGRIFRPGFHRWMEQTISNEALRSALSLTTSIGHCLAFFLYAQAVTAMFVMQDSFPRWIFAASDLAIAWVIIRLSSTIIQNKKLSRFVAVCIWILSVLHIMGLLVHITNYLHRLTITMSGTTISVYDVFKGLLLAAICIQIASLISKFTAKRIETSQGLSPSLQVLITKFINFSLYTAALLFTLSSVGLDLTSLAIFSSAIGIGVGFGLRTIFANYISGVLLLLDKSIKPGDNIEVGGVFGTVRNMHARYASVLTRSGKEFLIPNEQLIANEVINWTYSNTNIRLVIPVGVAYESDLHEVKALMEKAALGVDRILPYPAPRARLAGFGDSAVDMELCIWISDAEDGVGNVTSMVLFNIWDLFKEHNISIPFPQRDLHIKQSSRIRVDREEPVKTPLPDKS